MCGILAMFGASTQGNGELRAELLSLSKLLRHRGPDWNGITCFRNCYLAHERLAINGLLSGAQPITNINGDTALSVNGEIYNHLELREQLENHLKEKGKEVKFTTDSDCEVLLHLYKEYGQDFLKKVFVNGMFAFVLYDSGKDEYFVARDPFGVIPLYIGYGGDGTIWFSSELKGLQKHCDCIEVFPPGHYIVGSSLAHPDPTPEPQRFYTEQWITDSEYIPTNPVDLKVLRTKFEEAVSRHLLAEVPYGVLLSGGLDSSLVASVCKRQHEALGNTDKLRSFCIGLKGSPDLKAAEEVAKFLGTRHFSFEFTVQQGLDVLSDVIYHLETFDVTTVRASTPMFMLSRRIKATGVKMVLSGEGSDEVFGGYLYFHKAPNPEELHKETVRKVKDLYKYDCLRANKSTMAWGVEARVPFLDREFMDYAMNLDPSCKMSGSRMEKYTLRKAFDDPDDPYLPKDVLWRQKEQFSDGVGYGWIDSLKREAESTVTDLMMKFASSRFPTSTPKSKEEYMYRDIFSKHFPSPGAAGTVPQAKSIACSTPAALAWDEAWAAAADPSGRAVSGVHVEAYKDKQAV